MKVAVAPHPAVQQIFRGVARALAALTANETDEQSTEHAMSAVAISVKVRSSFA